MLTPIQEYGDDWKDPGNAMRALRKLRLLPTELQPLLPQLIKVCL